jgi:rare lipoprotein A
MDRLRMFVKKGIVWVLGAMALTAFVMGCGPKQSALKAPAGPSVGLASYYGHKFQGRRTASGERFDMHAFTAAHPRLAFGTRVRVTNLQNNRSVDVRINDRGPFVKGRIIDLSYAAAKKIGMLSVGVVKVQIAILP